MDDNDAGPTVGPSKGSVEPLALFEILIRENADSLTTFLRANVEGQAVVDDCFQETMLVAWRKIAEYDRARPFGAWLRGIAKRIILAYYRKSAREVSLSSDVMLDFIDQRMSQIDRHPGDTFDERIEALRDCLARLEALYREPVDLHYGQGKTAEWIGEHLATTKDAIQKRLQRARLQLAECLERKGVLVVGGANP